MDKGLDTGSIISQASTLIGPNEFAGSLHDRLAQLGAQNILPTLRGLADGTLLPEPQSRTGVTYAPLLKKSDGLIPWSFSAQEIHDHVRAMTPWPGAQTALGDTALKVGATLLLTEGNSAAGVPGTIHRIGPEGAWVCTGGGSIIVQKVQPSGRKMMSFRDYLRGNKISLPARFGAP
jgi:methionyl-tRNA formyltransferase